MTMRTQILGRARAWLGSAWYGAPAADGSGLRAGLMMLACVVLLSVAAPLSVPANAQGGDNLVGSYVTPFPAGDVYKVFVLGDSLADGLWAGLQRGFDGDAGLAIVKKGNDGAGLTRDDRYDWAANAQDMVERETFEIAVIVMGTTDRRSLRIDGRRYQPGSDEWRAEYSKRVDRLIKALGRKGAAIYWLGLPIMRGDDARADVEMMNAIFRERAVLNSIRFIDSYQAFSDQDGNFSEYGPDMTGKMGQLRDRDGVHFTLRGYRKLAHLIERDLRRDLALARAERDLPLAGDQTEQAQLRQRVGAQRQPGGGRAGADASGRSQAVATHARPGVAAAQAYRADNSKISLPGDNGQPLEIELVRPSIPGAVVAHIMRTSSARKPVSMGRTLASELPGGMVALGSVVSLPEAGSEAGVRQGPLTQTPYYKVLIKGEPLPAKPGRADDFRWPRYLGQPSG